MRRAGHPVPSVGFPRMEAEAGERRDFLPELVASVADLGGSVAVERGIGEAMGLGSKEYRSVGPMVHVVNKRAAYAQDVVVILRSPDPRFPLLRPGATLLSMLHFPTRPMRVRRLVELGVEAVSLDSLRDDDGRRLVENLRAVGWNGVEAAFEALGDTYPTLGGPRREPIRVTVMGAGAVAKHAVEAATKYGSLERNAAFERRGLPGVEVTVLGRNCTRDAPYLRQRLTRTDVLVDATERDDAARPIVRNAWLGLLPAHAVICDLVVDPYLLDGNPPTVRGIEGIAAGNLDRWILPPGDEAWDRTVPSVVPSAQRRTVVSCYSWPGVRPRECMEHYGRQLAPLLRRLVQRGGALGLRRDGDPVERALHGASLRTWTALERTARRAGAVAPPTPAGSSRA